MYPDPEPAGDYAAEKVAIGICGVGFEYLSKAGEPLSDEGWSGYWQNQTNLPAAVRMKLASGGQDGHQEVVSTVFIRGGGGIVSERD